MIYSSESGKYTCFKSKRRNNFPLWFPSCHHPIFLIHFYTIFVTIMATLSKRSDQFISSVVNLKFFSHKTFLFLNIKKFCLYKYNKYFFTLYWWNKSLGQYSKKSILRIYTCDIPQTSEWMLIFQAVDWSSWRDTLKLIMTVAMKVNVLPKILKH